MTSPTARVPWLRPVTVRMSLVIEPLKRVTPGSELVPLVGLLSGGMSAAMARIERSIVPSPVLITPVPSLF